MVRTRAHVRPATKASTALKILTNVCRDRRASTMASASIRPDRLRVIARKVSLDHGAKQMSTNAKVIRVKMTEAVWTTRAHFDAYACQVRCT